MKNKFIIRIVYISCFVFLMSIFHSYNCLRLNLISVPDLVNRSSPNPPKKILVLFGKKICTNCSIGAKIKKFGTMKGIIILVPKDYTKYDVQNLKSAFSLPGIVIIGNESVENFISKIKKCSNVENFILEINNNKIDKILRL